MKSRPLDEKSVRFMKLVFDKAKEDYDSKDFDYVKAKITKSLEGLTVFERKVALATLRRICIMFDVDDTVKISWMGSFLSGVREVWCGCTSMRTCGRIFRSS
jgi:hypothetical protein